MNISYDVRVDALSIRLFPGEYKIQTKQVDDDIYLDFDERDRLVSIEVLDASKRVDLRNMFPVQVRQSSESSKSPLVTPSSFQDGSEWHRVRIELIRRERAHLPVETLNRRWRNWVEEVADDYVVLRREKGKGRAVKITRRKFEGAATRPYILRALRELAPSR